VAVALDQADAPTWYDFVTKFDTTYRSFYDNYNAIMALGPYIQNSHPELLPQYMDMLQAGAVNADRLEGLKATRDYVYSWLQWLQSGASDISSFVYSGAQSTYDWAKRQLGLGDAGLGVIPVAVAVIGVSAAIAALVVIAKWITDAYVFAQRLNALQDAERRGMTPQAAAAYVDSTLGPVSSGGILGIPWTLLIWGALAIALGPPIIKAITGGERR
jgi:hypothetical protein